MLVKSFSGRTIPEALEKVRTALGEQALIIETRTLNEPGMFGRKIGVEVVAAIDHAENRPSPRRSSGLGALTAAPAGNPLGRQDTWNRIAIPRELDRPAPATTQDSVSLPMLPEASGISNELAALRKQIERLSRGESAPSQHLGADLAAHLEALELPAEHIAECDEAIACAGERLRQEQRALFAEKLLGNRLPLCHVDWERTRSLMLIGPTGVGKTTTIAKLAGELVLNQHKRVALITLDTYRVGAADQLRAYADLLDIPCAVAQTPAQLAEAAQRLAPSDVILIDSAGRSPHDSARVHELRGFCRAIEGLTVALALSAGCGRAEFAAIQERFSLLPIQCGIITKLDECAAPGRLYGCLRRHKLPIAWVTTGQEVPDDIAKATPDHVVTPLFAGRTLAVAG